ncbi:PspA/IM30 family protein [Paenibacillus physcomitrellae]|uniref:Phage shock protein A n=1 Tax=Paenibacillus physcomitrellae TaxID=1619311 RepID=A0ABQ1GEP5_9BACL|nr:PspA/IM30 family protein [Paenibacillus physcomitrellae]GGA42253.1 phage shock protein A [Paenibacillus physcomitrellae]
MGILSRFRQVMKMNVNALLDKAADPEQEADAYMRSLSSDLGQLEAETAAVQADERRARQALDEAQAEIRKLQRYAEKSMEAGREEDALDFLKRKADREEKLIGLRAAYNQAAAQAEGMKRMKEKLLADLNRLEKRQAELKGKLAEAKFQQRLNESGGANSAFKALEEKADLALNAALALAELRGGAEEDDLDTLIAKLEQAEGVQDSRSPGSSDDDKPSSSNWETPVASPEEELAAIKEKLNRKE